ncbi:MAG: hypothetical protein E7055_12945 [Lentisphaerae bacterium]|nr:hypothetical protein [Lentisphaerota bacterium]
MKELMKNFRAPGAEFRGAPFWAWNAKLDKAELIRQIHIFKEMGLGGFFMHSRVGLNTVYLGKEWFECIKACVNEAKKLGMQAHLYDEDRWPSGAAGSLVTRDDRYKYRYCSVNIYSRAADALKEENGTPLAWFSAKVSGSVKDKNLVVKDPVRLKSPADFKFGRGRKLIRFAVFLAENDSWFNGATYLDSLNPEAVQKFVEVTHDIYFREVGKEFGKTVPSIFTDEPNFWTWGKHGISLPWTDKLPEIFRKKYNLDVLDYLPELFFTSVRKYSSVRVKYYNLLTELFCTAFSGTIGKWCGAHNIQMTGHVLLEDRLAQALYVGAAMRFYEYMQMPGIDLLTEHWRIFNTAKQCTSMAHQFGRKRRLSETYGCTGWDFPFAGHKALGDWQYALGINFRCQHLAWYSAGAEAKRDYPASISYQSSWHDKYHVVEDYFGRLGAVMSAGEEMCDLLVIHPIETAWLKADLNDIAAALKKEEKHFIEVTDTLLSQKLDFDFGDEEIMSRYGKVKDGKVIINKAAYRAVLVPRIATIRSTTLALLKKFAEQGGTVVYVDAPPAFLDGEPSKEPAKAFAKFRKASLSGSVKLLEKVTRRVSVMGPQGRQIGPVLARLADAGKAYSLFLCNYGAEFKTATMQNDCLVRDRKLKFPEARVEVIVPQRGKVYELDPLNGTVSEVKAAYRKDRYVFDTAFEELGSHLYLITAEDPGKLLNAPAAPALKAARKLPASGWNFELNEPNVLVLDHADWTVDGKARGKNEFFLKLDDDLRGLLDKPARGGSMVQPWLREQVPAKKTVNLELTYHIRIKDVPSADCRLAVEHPELYQFELNGKKLKAEVDGWWCDIIMQCIKVPAKLLKKGENLLVLRSKYHENLPGLESLFLLGEFGVSAGETVTALPQTLAVGDWCAQGLRHYAGNVTYSRELEIPAKGAQLEFGDWRGVLLGVRIDDGKESVLPWPPYRVMLPGGKHRIALTVYGSRRNAMGPFYCKTAWPSWTGPYQFKLSEVKNRQLVPCGLLTEPVLKAVK